MPLEHQIVESLVKPAMMDIPPPFLIFDGGYEGVPITVTRASTKLLMGPAGIFYTVPANVQPHEWELGGAYIGRRYEEERTWRLLHNRDWTNAAYDTVTNITAVKDATGLLGVANSASTLTATAANGVIRQSITLASAERTFSVNVKRKTGTGDIDITDDGGSNYTTLTGLSSSIWTRHQITRTQANPDVGFRIVTSGDAIEVDFGGVEEGAFATSHVEVGATAVVRAPDVPTITGTNFSKWFNAIEGTIFVDYDPDNVASGSLSTVLEINDGTANEAFRILEQSGDLTFVVGDGGVVQANISLDTMVAVRQKVVVAYKANDFVAVKNGGTVGIDTGGTLPTVDRMKIGGSVSAGREISGTITRLPYWPDRRPNIEMQSLTA